MTEEKQSGETQATQEPEPLVYMKEADYALWFSHMQQLEKRLKRLEGAKMRTVLFDCVSQEHAQAVIKEYSQKGWQLQLVEPWHDSAGFWSGVRVLMQRKVIKHG